MVTRATALAAALALAATATALPLEEGKIYWAKDVPAMKLAKAPAKAGTLDCRSKRTIPTWNNEEVPVCEAALCAGAAAMKHLKVDNGTAPPRFSDARLAKYMDALGEFFLFSRLPLLFAARSRPLGRPLRGRRQDRGRARCVDARPPTDPAPAPN